MDVVKHLRDPAMTESLRMCACIGTVGDDGPLAFPPGHEIFYGHIFQL